MKGKTLYRNKGPFFGEVNGNYTASSTKRGRMAFAFRREGIVGRPPTLIKNVLPGIHTVAHLIHMMAQNLS